LAGAHVWVLPDADEPGRKHAQLVASKLHGTAQSVHVVTVPQVANALDVHVKDVSDFFDAGGTVEDLQTAIEAAPEWSADTTDQEQPANEWRALVEDGAIIIEKELPPVTELVEGLITDKTKCTIASVAKAGKTLLAVDLALSIARGVPFLGRQTLQRKVLYVNLELRPQTFDRRVKIIESEEIGRCPRGFPSFGAPRAYCWAQGFRNH
jgi:hypothetical protein